ncbi:MAG: hypothetical protein K2K44_04410, partial [Oscillospiraceae bacterium]|nr:hypothetical protein [Oscillospiraceae bacterium]
MKKFILIFLSAWFLIFFTGVTASAEDYINIAAVLKNDNECIVDNLTPEVKEFFEENNISPSNPETMTE